MLLLLTSLTSCRSLAEFAASATCSSTIDSTSEGLVGSNTVSARDAVVGW